MPKGTPPPPRGQKNFPGGGKKPGPGGVGLISPPPHHDILTRSEDLAQLIFGPQERQIRKLPFVKAGCRKSRWEQSPPALPRRAPIIIHCFGLWTGGRTVRAIDLAKHAGSPWESDLRKTTRRCVSNGLRSRIRRYKSMAGLKTDATA